MSIFDDAWRWLNENRLVVGGALLAAGAAAYFWKGLPSSAPKLKITGPITVSAGTTFLMRVEDQAGKPVANATIKTRETPTTTSVFAVTGADGYTPPITIGQITTLVLIAEAQGFQSSDPFTLTIEGGLPPDGSNVALSY